MGAYATHQTKMLPIVCGIIVKTRWMQHVEQLQRFCGPTNQSPSNLGQQHYATRLLRPLRFNRDHPPANAPLFSDSKARPAKKHRNATGTGVIQRSTTAHRRGGTTGTSEGLVHDLARNTYPACHGANLLRDPAVVVLFQGNAGQGVVHVGVEP